MLIFESCNTSLIVGGRIRLVVSCIQFLDPFGKCSVKTLKHIKQEALLFRPLFSVLTISGGVIQSYVGVTIATVQNPTLRVVALCP